jgi:hypothetical protein
MILRRLSLVIVMTLALGACDKANETADSPSDDEVVSTDNPVEEGTGPETPRPTEGEKSVSLPTLPVGGSASGEPEAQCVTASFLATLPDGVSVKVTGVRFSADGVSERNGSDCDDPPCLGFVFTTENTCAVPVDASGTSEQDARMLLDGKCLAEDLSACDALRDQHQSVQLNVPPEETTTDEPPASTDEPSPSTTE